MMDDNKEQVRALGLMSGGLDSQLAVCLLRDQGIQVEAVFFESPFFGATRARTAASNLGIHLHVVDFTQDIISLLDNPPNGFGRCMNPCIDCHANMIRRAWELAHDSGAHFVFTGEVLNQRPMSQRHPSLLTVARDSGVGDKLLRPLSALRLAPTDPEKRGLVDRTKLLALDGRSRKPQFELAERFGITEYPSPAGGCRLTEPNFSRRLRDLQANEGLHGVGSINLLRIGRHLRLAPKVKIIVGRNERDNVALEGGMELYDLLLTVEDTPGPSVLVPLGSSKEHVLQAASICARYSDCDPGASVTVRVRSARGIERVVVTPASVEEVQKLMIQ